MKLDELVRNLHTKMPMATQEDAIAFAHRLVAELAKQEPVAWRDDDGRIYTILPEFMKHKSGYSPLYAAPVIPAGWVMVPDEPTERQWEEGKIMLSAMLECGTALDIGIVYKAMLSAAPKGE